MNTRNSGWNRREWFAGALAVNLVAAPVKLPGRIRVAVIGQEGHLGEILGPLPSLPDVEVVGYCDATAQALASLGKKKGLEKAKGYLDGRRMLDELKPDVVGVVNDDGARARAVLDVLERGMHCIAEKPLAIERKDLERVKKAAAKSKGKLSMLLPLRFAPQFLAMREVVASGEIGEVLLLGGQKSYKRGASSAWKNKRASYGSTMLWIGPHLVDLFYFAGGQKMTEAFCWQTNLKDEALGDRENIVAAAFRLANGGMAELRMDYLRPDSCSTHEDDRLRVAGTKGVVEYTAATGVTVLSDRGKGRRLEELPAAENVFVDFLEAVYNGKKSALPVEDVFHVSEAIQAAEDSSRMGRAVKVLVG